MCVGVSVCACTRVSGRLRLFLCGVSLELPHEEKRQAAAHTSALKLALPCDSRPASLLPAPPYLPHSLTKTDLTHSFSLLPTPAPPTLAHALVLWQVSSKAKKSALKWLGSLTGDGPADTGSAEQGDDASSRSRCMEVIDIDAAGMLTVMHSESGERFACICERRCSTREICPTPPSPRGHDFGARTRWGECLFRLCANTHTHTEKERERERETMRRHSMCKYSPLGLSMRS